MGKDGLKRVANRRDDALSRTRWDRLESLLADYYRALGYRVEHVGTGASGSRFDGGIDLKLYRDDQYTVVQCKGWNAYKVPHNDVHQLLGIMINEGANGAVLVTSGEFTKAAIEAAVRHGHVRLIDGDELREMLGPLPQNDAEDGVGTGHDPLAGSRGIKGLAGEAMKAAGARLLTAAEDRIRGGGRARRRGGSILGTLIWAKLAGAAVGFAFLLVAIYLLSNIIKDIGTRAIPSSERPAQAVSRPTAPEQARRTATGNTGAPRHDASSVPPQLQQPTEAEIRESQRRADEAMKVLEAHTPEM